MTLEKKLITVAQKIKLGSEQITVDSSVLLDEQLTKLLSYSSYPVIETVEVSLGEVNVSGKMAIKICYMTSENKIVCKDAISDFSSKFSNSEISPSLKVLVKSKLIDATASVLSETNIKIASVIELFYYAIKQEDVNLLVSASEDICLKPSETNIVKLVSHEEQNFEEEIKLSIKDKFERLLSADADIILKDATAGVNFVTLSGDIVSRVMYVSDEESGKIITLDNIESFKTEVEITGVSQTSKLDITLFPKKEQIKADINSEDGNVNLTINLPNKVVVSAFEEESVNCSSDIYSLTNNLELVTSSFQQIELENCEYFESKIEGGLTLSETQPRVDKILAVTSPYLISTNSYISDGEVVLEGIAYANVIYLNDEEMTTNSIQIEVPFKISEKTVASENYEIVANLILDNVDVIVKKGRELYFDAKVKANVCYYRNKTEAVLSDAVEGDLLPAKEQAIEIYFGKQGNALWDIAKNLNISLETLKNQNPNVSEVLEENTNLIIYYQKK